MPCVGIAGENDLDASDLCAPTSLSSSTGPERALHTQSAQLRDKLLVEVEKITSADLATTWASEALAAKNSLTATDAKLVEDAFERRLLELPSSEAAAPANHEPSVPQIAGPQVIATTESTDQGQAKGA